MALKAEGIWGCTVLGGKAGTNEKNIPTVQINVQITDGPSAGHRCTYEDVVDAKSAKYVAWSLNAVGWKGQTLKTLEADVTEWIAKTGGASTVEIKHLEIKNGKNAGKIWDKVNGIGRGAARAIKPIEGEALNDADAALREFAGAPPDDNMNDHGGAPPDDAPHAADSDDIPFASCSVTRDVNPIAKVLR